jgi:hypothetical protein
MPAIRHRQAELWNVFLRGPSHGRWSHVDTPYYILYGESLKKYNLVRLKDFNVQGYADQRKAWATTAPAASAAT